MKTTTLAAALGAFATMMAMTACSGLDTGNGDAGHITFALSVDDVPAPDQSGNAFTLTAAHAHVRHVEVYLPAGTTCDGLSGASLAGCDGEKIRIDGPWDVDLITGQTTPELPTIEVPLGTLTRIDVRFDPSAATDLTLTAAGTTTFDGQPTPFTLALKFDEVARFDASSGIKLSPKIIEDTFLRLDPSSWFATLPLTQCAADGDLPIDNGTIVLEDGKSSCSKVENTVRDAIKASGRVED